MDLLFLTDRQREVYKMRENTGKTFIEIAEELRLSVSAVTEHYRSAQRRIREFENYKIQQDFDESKLYTVKLSRAELKVLELALRLIRTYDVEKILKKQLRKNDIRHNHLKFIYEMVQQLTYKIHNIIY